MMMRQRKEEGGGRNDGMKVQNASEGEFPATIHSLTISQLK